MLVLAVRLARDDRERLLAQGERAEVAQTGAEVEMRLFAAPFAALVADEEVALGVDGLARGIHFGVVGFDVVDALRDAHRTVGDDQIAHRVVGEGVCLNVDDVRMRRGNLGGHGIDGGRRRVARRGV